NRRVQGHVAEDLVGIAAQGRDRGDADDNDQGQHDGVLDRRRTVFRLHELNQLVIPLAHNFAPFLKPRPTGAAPAKPPSSTSRPSGMRLSKTVDPAIQEHMRNSLTPSATLFTTAPDALARGCLPAFIADTLSR